MQCMNCGFQNLPGLAVCGRCGSPLDLNALDIDVNPPRASRTAKRLRAATPRRAAYAARDAARDTVRSIRRRVAEPVDVELGITIPPWPLLVRMTVPGWAQIYDGRPLLGWTFLVSWAFLIVLGLVGWGTVLGSLLLGLALSVHASSVLSVVMEGGRTVLYRLLVGIGMAILLMFTIYRPAAWVLTNVAAYREMLRDTAPFQRGDVILYNRWARIDPGDLVLVAGHTGRSRDLLMPEDGGHVQYRIQENELIDRLVGLPGDRVSWDGKRLARNGVPVEWSPLVPGKLPAKLEFLVPPDTYLVLPTTSNLTSLATTETQWLSVGSVPRAEILGRVYLRKFPWRRFRWLR